MLEEHGFCCFYGEDFISRGRGGDGGCVQELAHVSTRRCVLDVLRGGYRARATRCILPGEYIQEELRGCLGMSR